MLIGKKCKIPKDVSTIENDGYPNIDIFGEIIAVEFIGFKDLDDSIYDLPDWYILIRCDATGILHSCFAAESDIVLEPEEIEKNKIYKEIQTARQSKTLCKRCCGKGRIIHPTGLPIDCNICAGVGEVEVEPTKCKGCDEWINPLTHKTEDCRAITDTIGTPAVDLKQGVNIMGKAQDCICPCTEKHYNDVLAHKLECCCFDENGKDTQGLCNGRCYYDNPKPSTEKEG